MLAPHTNSFNKGWTITISLILFTITVLTRIPFTSKILSHWDSVQFAIATEKYDITVHQPHPPGYFLYVMLGKLLNHFTGDANTSFIVISIVASGLTVVSIFLLAHRMFDGMTALGASVLAISSPLFWFYSEVALTYIVESFFSVFFAYICWRILNGEHKLIFISALLLALAGGIRQSTIVFLIPLWLYSIKNVRYEYILISFSLLIAGVVSWLLPMLSMTGGFVKYQAAMNEHWAETFEPFTCINLGFKCLLPYALKFFRFVSYGLGLFAAISIFCIIMTGFKNIKRTLFSHYSIFIGLWIAPFIFALILLFMHTANPGYSLFFIPALLIASVKIVKSATEKVYSSVNIFVVLILFTTIFNVYVFIFSTSPLSRNMLEKNYSYITNFVTSIRAHFSPSDTIIVSPEVLFLPNYIEASPRHFMYYLPEYRVYIIDLEDERIHRRGKFRKFYWQNHKIFISDTLHIPHGVKYFVSPIWDKRAIEKLREYGESIDILYDGDKKIAFYGDINLILKAYNRTQ